MPAPNNWSLRDMLALFLANGISNKQARFLIEKYDSLSALLRSQGRDTLVPASLLPGSAGPHDEADRQIETCRNNRVDMITVWDNRYPALLKQITDPPVILFVKGTIQPADSLSIAIVGTRKAGIYGKTQAERFAAALAESNIIVTSGLAYGIDTAAHMAAISAKGITYAVIASGQDCLSPDLMRKNADKIIDSGGCVISVFPCGVKALPGYFLLRNRIISGISKATLVIESKEKGGALWTAKFAAEQNRDVFALPGSVVSEKSAGTNRLIKNNIAAPALSPEEMLHDMGLAAVVSGKQTRMPDFTNADEAKVFSAIDSEPVHIDEIFLRTALDMSRLMVILLNLEFANHVRQLPGKYYIRN